MPNNFDYNENNFGGNSTPALPSSALPRARHSGLTDADINKLISLVPDPAGLKSDSVSIYEPTSQGKGNGRTCIAEITFNSVAVESGDLPDQESVQFLEFADNNLENHLIGFESAAPFEAYFRFSSAPIHPGPGYADVQIGANLNATMANFVSRFNAVATGFTATVISGTEVKIESNGSANTTDKKNLSLALTTDLDQSPKLIFKSAFVPVNGVIDPRTRIGAVSADRITTFIFDTGFEFYSTGPIITLKAGVNFAKGANPSASATNLANAINSSNVNNRDNIRAVAVGNKVTVESVDKQDFGEASTDPDKLKGNSFCRGGDIDFSVASYILPTMYIGTSVFDVDITQESLSDSNVAPLPDGVLIGFDGNLAIYDTQFKDRTFIAGTVPIAQGDLLVGDAGGKVKSKEYNTESSFAISAVDASTVNDDVQSSP